MGHVIEPAVSGRARCRGCGRPIGKGTLRFGERLDNPYGEGDTTVWYHPRCAAYRRPEPFLETLAGVEDPPAEVRSLEQVGAFSRAHRRLCRLGAVERASSGRARCRHCRTLIERNTLRIPLLFYEEGVFSASGFLHLACAPGYFETPQLLDCARHFAPELEPADLAELERVLD